MTRTLAILFLSFLFVFPLQGKAAISTPDFAALLNEGGTLAKEGEWDQSEIAFLKAAKSPLPDDRMKAYEGLMSLYKRLRLFKKAGRVEEKIKLEKALLGKIVPKDEKHYKTYKPEEGETYAKIAAREKVSLKWLLRANENKPLLAGKAIKIPKDRYTLHISKKKKIMEWRRGKDVVKTYSVSVGRKGMESPDGEFEVISRVKHPTWYWLNEEIPADSPKNLLGPRWLGINHKGYGIHGTKDPSSIGAAQSHGCIRMHNEDVEELFEWIPIGTKVFIHENTD
jgi:lipoprotein-anchoring transpeptidase ErfK/SrfK